MCGIAVGRSYEIVSRLLDRTLSRGPDETRMICCGEYLFGFHRLAIVARGEDGQQPYMDDDNIIMFTGELYNWDRSFGSEVRWLAHLVKTGHDFWRFLCGQYFIVVYNRKERDFIVVRDHLGIIPGYIRLGAGGVVISSEKDHDGGWTEVTPGTACLIESGKLEVIPTWLPSLGLLELNPTDHVLELRKAVYQIAQHTDLGFTFALGGLDSMILLQLLCEGGFVPNQVITVGYEHEGDSGDLFLAQKFCDRLGVGLSKVYISKILDEGLVKRLSDRLGEDLENNLIKRWVAYRAAHIAMWSTNKVIIGGDGADELFYGYPYFDEYTEPELSFRGLKSLFAMYYTNLDALDRGGMLFSKEFRPVYLHRDYREWVLKHKRGKRKEDLRTLARFIGIPDEFINRPKWTKTDYEAKNGQA